MENCIVMNSVIVPFNWDNGDTHISINLYRKRIAEYFSPVQAENIPAHWAYYIDVRSIKELNIGGKIEYSSAMYNENKHCENIPTEKYIGRYMVKRHTENTECIMQMLFNRKVSDLMHAVALGKFKG